MLCTNYSAIKKEIYGGVLQMVYFRINPDNEHIINFGLQHGLNSLDFTSTSSFKSQQGELLFGNLFGFSLFTPETITQPKQPSMPTVTELRVLNEIILPQASSILSSSIHKTQQITLNYKQNLFSLAFNSVELADAKNLQYQYKLAGFNDDWLAPLPGRPQATFTNLNSGRYQLLLRARRDNEPWVQNKIPLEIIITPAPWLTWWAYCAYSFILLSILLSIFWQFQQRKIQRTRYLANLEKQKKQLDLALWGSGDELWDWNIINGEIRRMNCLDNSIARNSIDEFTHSRMTSLIHPDDISRVQKSLQSHLDGQQEFYEETYRLKTADNRWMWVLDRGRVVEKDEKQQPIRFTGTLKNIGNLKKTEEALRELTEQLEDRVNIRTQELQSSNVNLTNTLNTLKLTQQQLIESEKMAILGNLVVGVSHEINTPLGTSITALSLLKERSSASLS